MGRLASFTHVSVDGFYAGPNGDVDWFKDVPKDAAWGEWSHAQAPVLAS